MEGGLHISIAPHVVGEFMGLPITSTLVSTWVISFIIVAGAFLIGRSLKVRPGKGQVAVESLVTLVYGYVKNALGNVQDADRFFPLIMSIFIFIFLSNLFGLTPIMETVGLYHHGEFAPLLYPANADLNLTLALAIISFLTIEISGIIYLGFFTYAGKFFNFSSPMNFAVGILELIGNLARLVSLSFRLFGNILAGHLLILVIMFFVPFFGPIPFIAFEVFVAVMQAGIFALLTLFFIKLSIEKPHGAHVAH